MGAEFCTHTGFPAPRPEPVSVARQSPWPEPRGRREGKVTEYRVQMKVTFILNN